MIKVKITRLRYLHGRLSEELSSLLQNYKVILQVYPKEVYMNLTTYLSLYNEGDEFLFVKDDNDEKTLEKVASLLKKCKEGYYLSIRELLLTLNYGDNVIEDRPGKIINFNKEVVYQIT